MNPLGLNVGCGPVPADGWVNVDIAPWDEWPPSWLNMRGLSERPAAWVERPGLYVVDDCSLPFHDDTFDGAVAHHVLQMISWPDLVPWLSEVRRVLKPDAVLRCTVPDLQGALRAARRGDRSWFPVEGETVDEQLCVYLSQNGATRSVFTGDAIALLFERAGFAHVTWTERPAVPPLTHGPAWLLDLDSRLAESLIVEGVKL